ASSATADSTTHCERSSKSSNRNEARRFELLRKRQTVSEVKAARGFVGHFVEEWVLKNRTSGTAVFDGHLRQVGSRVDTMCVEHPALDPIALHVTDVEWPNGAASPQLDDISRDLFGGVAGPRCVRQ